jgi:hypothetical protein
MPAESRDFPRPQLKHRNLGVEYVGDRLQSNNIVFQGIEPHQLHQKSKQYRVTRCSVPPTVVLLYQIASLLAPHLDSS